MPKKILLIDDEELITRTLANALEKHGYEVWVAKKGDDALVMTEEEDFDLIISDIRMPGMNGVETVKKILEGLKLRGAEKIPAIFITGYADHETEIKARALNPHAYIHKPFDFPHFINQVKGALEKSGATR